MSSEEELRASIAACQQRVQEEERERQRLVEDLSQAASRQRLRRQLEEVQGTLQIALVNNKIIKCDVSDIDLDRHGPHLPNAGNGSRRCNAKTHGEQPTATLGVTDCSAAVVRGEVEWSIKGLSWLPDTLAQLGEQFASGPVLRLAGHDFGLCYHPTKGRMGRHDQCGSLVVWHAEAEDPGVAFRYSILIKNRAHNYVQWANSGSVCLAGDTDDMIFGPDVCESPATPSGVFGMSHEQLQDSEWVTDDVLSMKLKVEVRPPDGYLEEERVTCAIEIPPSNLIDQLLLLLDSGVGSDVAFIVQGETIRAHSLIISARSEVFQRQFACGLQESKSKEVTVQDCDAVTFKAFLRYLYSDSFVSLDEFIERSVKESSFSSTYVSSAVSPTSDGAPKISILQQLLAVSHKYQLSRLQLWCEHQLCAYISIERVCSVICQAHVYEAKKLEEKCLSFIKAHMSEVAKTDGFGLLGAEWPQVFLKITLHNAGVPESAASTAVEKQENARKRKRDG
eukprot:TRINITY_DN106752_c0_g1_i1.p1 TRINITY_DN106752_c0_g1~~TRINITY_DN106752_c0_g1_i1.p1  ORF type:complete len:507 (-),score=78.16 TRINITY_DN106752_c0_g1_i1:51-1571(-)